MLRKIIAIIFVLATFACSKQDPVQEVILPSIDSFEFKSILNPGLEQDIQLKLQGNTYTGSIGFMPPKMVASFTFSGESVTIKGVKQISGVSSNDFSTELSYSVSDKEGKTADYKIVLKGNSVLPVVEIYTEGGANIVSADDYINCNVKFLGGDYYKTFASTGRIKGRGNSTWVIHPKKPYQLKLDTSNPVFGMATDNTWVFLAEHSDKTLMRNMFAFEMGRISNLDFTPKGRFADVYLNNSYIGVYNICEKIEKGSNRVDIKDNGYLCEIDQFDRIDPGDTYFQTPSYYINIKDPDVVFNSPEHILIKNHINQFENVLMGTNFLDANTGYKNYIDLNSFVDWFLINEITRNPDARSWSSIYFSYIPGEKIKMGPIWDFDLSLGNANYDDHINSSGFWVLHNKWISRMYQDPVFKSAVSQRFEFYKQNLSQLLKFIDNNKKYLELSHAKNNQKWQVLGNWVWPNSVVLNSFEEEVLFIKNYLNKRITWLDANLSK